MTYHNSDDPNQTKMENVYYIARFITVYGTPIFLALIGLYLLVRAYEHGFYIGTRSLASLLFPLVIGSFLYVFKREFLQRLGSVSTQIGFFSSLCMGAIVMVALRFFARTLEIPIAEFMVSGCFSVLVFSTASTEEDIGLSYYYGTMSGILLYIIILGFPLLK